MTTESEDVAIDVNGARLQQHNVSQNEPHQPFRTWQGHRACVECRRKKTKCDMRQPICGLCQRTGGSCTFPTKRKTPEIRRPRSIDKKEKIYPRRLERLFHLLESGLSDEQLRNALSPQHLESKQTNSSSSDTPFDTPSSGGATPDDRIAERQPTDTCSTRMTKSPTNLPNEADSLISTRSSIQSLGGKTYLFNIPEQVLTELVHLFFDIVQAWFPLLHRPRFLERYMPNGVFSRETVSQVSDSEALILCGMFSLSARYSSNAYFNDIAAPDRGAQFADDATKYYGKLRTSKEKATLEYLQGCLMLVCYLYGSGPSHRAWILAGVCTRLVYELDICTMDEEEENWQDPAGWSVREECRRAFWLAWEIDTFGSILSRRPNTISRREVLVRLPVSDEVWFADKPVKSPVIDPRLSEAWKTLLESPNQDERAWFLIANYLLIICFETASARYASQNDRGELVDAVTCLSLVLSQRFGLEAHASRHLQNRPKHNWMIGMHLMLTCARGCVLSFEQAPHSGTSDLSALSRELSRIIYHWHPEHIPFSHPFLTSTVISVRAYPSKQMPPHSDETYQNNDVVNLILASFGSVWKLGSVFLDLRALLSQDAQLSSEQMDLAKRFSLYFPHNFFTTRSVNQAGPQSLLIAKNREDKPAFDYGVMDGETSEGLLGLLQLSQPIDPTMALGDLGYISREAERKFPVDDSDDWGSRLQLDYVCDDNQHFNYLQL